MRIILAAAFAFSLVMLAAGHVAAFVAPRPWSWEVAC